MSTLTIISASRKKTLYDGLFSTTLIRQFRRRVQTIGDRITGFMHCAVPPNSHTGFMHCAVPINSHIGFKHYAVPINSHIGFMHYAVPINSQTGLSIVLAVHRQHSIPLVIHLSTWSNNWHCRSSTRSYSTHRSPQHLIEELSLPFIDQSLFHSSLTSAPNRRILTTPLPFNTLVAEIHPLQLNNYIYKLRRRQ